MRNLTILITLFVLIALVVSLITSYLKAPAPTATPTPTRSPTATVTMSPGIIPTLSPSPTPSSTPSLTQTPTPTPTITPSTYFTIAVLPDTQYYSASHPEIFDNQTQWIANNAVAQNIVFVAQLGDLTNDWGVTIEWQRAKHSMDIIRNASIPYSVVPGNHDLDFGAGNTTYFDRYFPYTDFAGYSWYGGHYPSNSDTSNYELFSAMGQNFIVLNIVCTPSLFSSAQTWANDTLTQYSDREAILITHGYIDGNGAYTDSAYTSGKEVWSNIVRYHSNVIAVLCGHIHSQFHGSATGLNGNTIYNLLTDYQDYPSGGDGWLRLYKFYPSLNKISAVTYSPYLNQYDTTAAGQFDLSLTLTPTPTPSPTSTHTATPTPTSTQTPTASTIQAPE